MSVNVVKCVVCGKDIRLKMSNWRINKDGQYEHIHCPSKKIKEQEKEGYKKLTKKIKRYIIEQPRGYLKDNGGLNWMHVEKTIKKLRDDGYSYTDQLYALDKIVEQDNGFFGYGQVETKIGITIDKRNKKYKQIEQYKRHKQFMKNYKPDNNIVYKNKEKSKDTLNIDW